MALLLGLKGLTEWKVYSLIEKCNKLSQSVFAATLVEILYRILQDPVSSHRILPRILNGTMLCWILLRIL